MKFWGNSLEFVLKLRAEAGLHRFMDLKTKLRIEIMLYVIHVDMSTTEIKLKIKWKIRLSGEIRFINALISSM